MVCIPCVPEDMKIGDAEINATWIIASRNYT